MKCENPTLPIFWAYCTADDTLLMDIVLFFHVIFSQFMMICLCSCRTPALRLTAKVKKWVPDVPAEYFKLPGPEEKLDFLRRGQKP